MRTGNNARLTGHFRDLVSEPVLALEFAPLLNRIISPPIRPVRNLSICILTRVTLCTTQVNSQVIRPEEKVMLSRLVNIMVSLELRFVQERAEDGQLLYRLDPWVWGLCSSGSWLLMSAKRPVDLFVTYDGKRAADIPPPRYAVRHLVATEVSPC